MRALEHVTKRISRASARHPQDLWRLFRKHEGRPIHKWRHYFPAYDRHFCRFAGEPVTFIEIGVGKGGSVELWKKYFGPDSTIVGLDNRPETKEFEGNGINIRIGDQSDTSFLAEVVEEFGTPDIVLDDGSHRMDDVAGTFEYLFPRTAPDGVYLVEDMHTAYWPDFGGGLRREGTFIERAKAMVDELNAHFIPDDALPPTELTDSTASITFYDSIVAFERAALAPRKRVKTAKIQRRRRRRAQAERSKA